MLKSFMLGVITLTILFFLCLCFVIGIKTLKEFIHRYIFPEPKQQPVKITKPTPKPSRPKVVKSIEINPDEIERIYVKKSS